VIFLTISEIGSYALMIEISIGCDEFTVCILLHFLRQKPLSKILICMVLQFAPMLCAPQKCVGRWIRLAPLYFRGKSTWDFQFLRRQWIYSLSVRTSC
jgi:hypothetical protein